MMEGVRGMKREQGTERKYGWKRTEEEYLPAQVVQIKRGEKEALTQDSMRKRRRED